MKRMPENHFYIGLGTGRCGTVSLSEWVHIWHEYRTGGKFLSKIENKQDWIDDLRTTSKKYNRQLGDVSMDHINNLDFWFNQENVTMIGLLRDRDATVKSILAHRSNRIWFNLFPQFDFYKKADVERYWDWYYETLLKHDDKIMIVEPEIIPIRKNPGTRLNRISPQEYKKLVVK